MQPTKTPNPQTIIALDVGDKRVGVARANTLARLPQPLETLERTEAFWDKLADLIQRESASKVVVGLPRNLDGNDTPQTTVVRAFAQELEQRFKLPTAFQDEAATSVKAEAELRARGKPYARGDIDALAATYILEDYLNGL